MGRAAGEGALEFLLLNTSSAIDIVRFWVVFLFLLVRP